MKTLANAHRLRSISPSISGSGRPWLIGAAALAVMLGANSFALAQGNLDDVQSRRRQVPSVDNPRVRYSGVYAPSAIDTLAERMRAAGDLMIDSAVFERLLIENRIVNYDRLRERWLLRLDQVKIRREKAWERWEEGEDKRDRALQTPINAQARQDIRRLEVDITPTEAVQGRVLNQLLDLIKRASSNEQSLGDLSEILARTDPISLPERAGEQLKLIDGVGHSIAELSLTEGYEYQPPATLTKPPYDRQESALRASRQKMIDAVVTKREVEDADFNAANDALHEIIATAGQQFAEWKSQNPNFSNDAPEYQDFIAIRSFCEKAESQLLFLAANALPPEPFQGKSLQELIAHMARYGYRFAPGKPNAASTYLPLYEGMRSLSKRLIEDGHVADPTTVLSTEVPTKREPVAGGAAPRE